MQQLGHTITWTKWRAPTTPITASVGAGRATRCLGVTQFNGKTWFDRAGNFERREVTGRFADRTWTTCSLRYRSHHRTQVRPGRSNQHAALSSCGASAQLLEFAASSSSRLMMGHLRRQQLVKRWKTTLNVDITGLRIGFSNANYVPPAR